MALTDAPLVSVVIPCFDQARFLGDALASALTQSHEQREVIVVDDGSRDDTAAVAARHPEVRCLRQANQGLAAARNVGWRAAAGAYVVFLDADDWLRPDALAQGLACFARHPEAAFVWGHHARVDESRRPLPTDPAAGIRTDHYRQLLLGNCIGMHATVMYRRGVLEESGGFDQALAACEDYDLYLRIARRWAVQSHSAVVADYRQHGGNMSRDAEFMLHWAHVALERQREGVRERRELEAARREGLDIWSEYYWGFLADQARAARRAGMGWREVIRRSRVLVRSHPTRRVLRRAVVRASSPAAELWKRVRRRVPWPPPGHVDLGSLTAAAPLGSLDRDDTNSVARHFAAAFASSYSADLRSEALVVAESAASVADLALTGTSVASLDRLEEMGEDRFTAALVVEGLESAPDLDAAIRALRGVLRTGGTLLLALPGIHARRVAPPAQERWQFTPLSARRLLEEAFGAGAVQVEGHGNVLTAIASLQGLAAHSLHPRELERVDPRYPVVVCARAVKPPPLLHVK